MSRGMSWPCFKVMFGEEAEILLMTPVVPFSSISGKLLKIFPSSLKLRSDCFCTHQPNQNSAEELYMPMSFCHGKFKTQAEVPYGIPLGPSPSFSD